jgi:uncharacterized protein (DUF433 family)
VLLFDKDDPVLELPAYSVPDAASYVRVPYQTLRYWSLGRGSVPPLIETPDESALSFLNLLECHVLSALRSKYGLPIKVVRKSLDKLSTFYESKHPLLESTLSTDGINLFFDSTDELINLSQGGQAAMRQILSAYLQRIVYESGIPKFFPFVLKDRADEPRMISIVPTIAFGRSVIDGTGIATAVIAARFNAREPIPALAREYGRSEAEIQEAVIWEANRTAKAA